jgi:hypothetical protein
MIKTNIGPTDIYICESTANCIVYNPTETLANQIAEYIYKNNYICGAIYHTDINKALYLHRMTGGNIITDQAQAEAYEKTLC